MKNMKLNDVESIMLKASILKQKKKLDTDPQDLKDVDIQMIATLYPGMQEDYKTDEVVEIYEGLKKLFDYKELELL